MLHNRQSSGCALSAPGILWAWFFAKRFKGRFFMASPSIVENSIPAASNPLREHNFRMYWIGSATSIFQTTAQLTSIAAPTPAALVIKALGYAWAFFIDAISFLFVIAALWRLPDPPLPQTATKKLPVWKSIHEGFAYVYRDVPLR